MTAITNANNRAGLEVIANPNVSPDDALHNIQYFRNQCSGWNAFVFGNMDTERRQYDLQGNPLPTRMEAFLNTAEQYWSAQKAAAQEREANVQANLPSMEWLNQREAKQKQ